MNKEHAPTVPASATEEISGLPATLSADTVGLLYAHDENLALASGDQVIVYRLTRKRTGVKAKPLCAMEVDGTVTAMAESALGLLIATRCGGRSAIMRLQDQTLAPVLDISGAITAFASAGANAYAVVSKADGHAALMRIGVRQRAVVAEQPLAHGEMKVAINSAGGHVVVTDTRERTVRSADGDLRWTPIPTPAAARPPKYAHPTDCCGACCVPRCGCDDATTPERPGTEHPGNDRPGEDRPDDGRTPGGGAAIPSDGGGTVVGDGGRVDHHPPPGTGKRPCGRDLFFGVADLHRLGRYILATDQRGRHAAVLSADMNVIDEWQFGRGGALLLPGTGTSTLLMHTRSTGRWAWRDEARFAADYRPDLTFYPPVALETKTFIGQQTYALSHGQQPSPTSVKALLLPVIEGAQSFTGANLDGFGAFVNRVTLAQVKDYYDENSFGILKDLNISVFGVDVGPKAGPLTLPRAHVADYFFPAYQPAQLVLTKSSVTSASEVVFDGRESLKIRPAPLTGGPAAGELTFPFFALALTRDVDFFPVQVKFLGTEKLSVNVTLADGTNKVLALAFTAKTLDMPDTASIPGKLGELETYLDAVMQAAETAAGIATRLFAKPKARRIPQIGTDFGRLLITFAAATTTGTKLRVTASTATVPGGDPLGLSDTIIGTMPVSNTARINRYLENAGLLAQEAANFGYNDRRIEPPTTTFDATAGTLKTVVSIASRYGGPGAEVTFVSSSGLSTLFDAHNSTPNSASTANNAEAIRDWGDILTDAFSAAIKRLRDNSKPTNALEGFGAVIVMPLEPTMTNPADPNAPRASEIWTVTPLSRPFGFRGADAMATIIDRVDPKVQLQTNWALDFMANGAPDVPLICHEMGHALGFGDLYHQTGYRDELAYLGGWAMMDSHWDLPHHCGYHKMQAGWIPDGSGTETDYGRVYPLGLPDAAVTRTWELLLVPVELWRDSLVASARTAFGVGGDIPVVQLAYIDFGGDGATFGLIEARQPGAAFSQSLPIHNGGVLITNAITWTLDDRFATNGWYRRSLQLLNPSNVLTAAGDTFDLALAAELPVKGMSVQVVDRKTVEGDAMVYRVKVSRQNAEFVDLYFDNPPIYYKNPDLWVDWAGNNTPTPESLTPDYPVGQPTDQGEAIRVHPSHPELHWVVARVRNRGQVQAQDVKLNFFYYEPPGGGDGNKPLDVKDASHYKLIGSATLPGVPATPGVNDPVKALGRWDVPAGFGGHTCLLVQIEDYKIPRDSHGAALGSDDVWQVNNHAQKNVDKYEALSASPFQPIEFDFSVHNDGVTPELAYLEPDGLPYGMTLTVTPPEQTIPARGTVLFHCTLRLDDQIIHTGCENDQRFQLHAWRRDPESTVRWGGVEYEIKPRVKTVVKLGGQWDYSNNVRLDGTVTPNPGGGTINIRVDFQNHQAQWVSIALTSAGTFSWTGHAPNDSYSVDAVARFAGNRKFGAALSNTVTVKHPPIIG
ncbi:hypothetical protein [Nocardia sp. NPDC052566]|uniref:hypothetical protein n=1 Tax=Nocardia sp. NPDC052566 TaxID=3364330 RepID=UPI0037CB4656